MGHLKKYLGWSWLAVLLTAAPACADAALQQDSSQSVGLFANACIANPGNARAVRSWAVAHHLPVVAGDLGRPFLQGLGEGQVFSASNASGNFALVTFDDGRCSVISDKGDFNAAQAFLIGVLAQDRVDHETQSVWLNLDGLARQYIYRAALHRQPWLLSVTSRRNSLQDTPWLFLTIEPMVKQAPLKRTARR